MTIDWEGQVAWIRFGDPADGNALTWELARTLRAEMSAVAGTARCVVLASEGRIFCAGANLDMLRDFADPEQAESVRAHVYGAFQGLIRGIAAVEVPVLVRVHGPALGAGADLCLAGDIRIASDQAWLEESWIRLGTISALGGAYTLPRLVGPNTALDVLLTARRLSVDELVRCGVFQRSVPLAGLDREVRAVAGQIAAADPDAVRAMKRLVRLSDGLDVALSAALEEQVPLIARPEFGERVDRVREELRTRRAN